MSTVMHNSEQTSCFVTIFIGQLVRCAMLIMHSRRLAGVCIVRYANTKPPVVIRFY